MTTATSPQAQTGRRLTYRRVAERSQYAYELLRTAGMPIAKASELVAIAREIKEAQPSAYQAIIEYLSEYLEKEVIDVGPGVFEGPFEPVACIAQGLAEIDIESRRSERNLALLNFYFDFPTDILSDYYVNPANVVDFVPEEQLVYSGQGIREEFHGKDVMVLEAHHKDVAMFLGNTMETKIVPQAKKTTLVTMLNDPEGVTDEYALEIASAEEREMLKEKPNKMSGLKMKIRHGEGSSYAEALGIDQEYLGLNYRCDVQHRRVYQGRLLSYHSDYYRPSRKVEDKLRKKICTDQPDVLVLPCPKGSYHQNTRDLARILMGIIIDYNQQRKASGAPAVSIYFYSPNIDKNGFPAYGIEPNIVNFFTQAEEERKLELIEHYQSQLQRIDEYQTKVLGLDRDNAEIALGGVHRHERWTEKACAEFLLKVRLRHSTLPAKVKAARLASAVERSVNLIMDGLTSATQEKRNYLRIHIFDQNVFFETRDVFDFLPIVTGKSIGGNEGLVSRLGLNSILIDAEWLRRTSSLVEESVRRLISALVADDALKLVELLRNKASPIKAEVFSAEQDHCVAQGITAHYWQEWMYGQLEEKPKVVVSTHQPGYQRFLGGFYKMAQSDVFVFTDCFQFVEQEWMNRQLFRKTFVETDEHGVKGAEKRYLTVPVHVKFRDRDKINNVKINNSTKWREKHERSIRAAYCRDPYFRRYFDFFEELYSRDWESLNALCEAMTRHLAKRLGITDTFFIRASLLGPIQGVKGESFANMMHRVLGRFTGEPDKELVYLYGADAARYFDVAPGTEAGQTESEKFLQKAQAGIRVGPLEYDERYIEQEYGVEARASALEILFQLQQKSFLFYHL